jgi:hypothetical protein
LLKGIGRIEDLKKSFGRSLSSLKEEEEEEDKGED